MTSLWPSGSGRSHPILKQWSSEQPASTAHYVRLPAQSQSPTPASPSSPSPSPLSSWHATNRLSLRRILLGLCILSTIYLTSYVYPTHLKRISSILTTDDAQGTCPVATPAELRNAQPYTLPADVGSLFDNIYYPLSRQFRTAKAAAMLSGAGALFGASGNRDRKAAPTPPPVPDCLDDHIAWGALCIPASSSDSTPKLDVVWTYVNGSDALHVDAYKANRQDIMDRTEKRLPAPKLGSFREFDELRYSIRSVLQHFRDNAGKFFVLTSDFPYPASECSSTDPEWRLGQIPQWLSSASEWWSKWRDGNVSLEVVHHSSIFPPLRNTSIFNSLAIESRFGMLENVSDNFIYMNDDVFFNANLTTADFYSQELGPVFRMQSDLLVGNSGSTRGEWVALEATNRLLDARFGERRRPYLAHIAKTLSKPVLRELSYIWETTFARTATHPFRSLGKLEPDINTAFLYTHYVVERWRETLLWSWVVGSLGDESDEWETRRAWRDLGGVVGQTSLNITRAWRKTLDIAEEREPSKKTGYIYSSLDGYPYAGLGKSGFHNFPSFSKPQDGEPRPIQPHHGTVCQLELERCFKSFTSANEVFRHVAFAEPTCGDCIVQALVNRSGELGLDAFLPSPSKKFPKKMRGTGFFGSYSSEETGDVDYVPRLPMTADWKELDFRLKAILPPVDGMTVREWVLRALYRYRFVLGSTSATFIQLQSLQNTRSHLADIDSYRGTNSDPAIICINDDVGSEANKVKGVLKAWFEHRWSMPGKWEGP